MKTKGFTLIELLVVITIIGILATGATAVYSGAQAKARDSQRQNDITSIISSENYYLTDNDTYTDDVDDLADYLGSTLVAPKADSGTASPEKGYYGNVSLSTSVPALVVGACGMSPKKGNTDAASDTAGDLSAFVKTAGDTGTVTATCDTTPSILSNVTTIDKEVTFSS